MEGWHIDSRAESNEDSDINSTINPTWLLHSVDLALKKNTKKRRTSEYLLRKRLVIQQMRTRSSRIIIILVNRRRDMPRQMRHRTATPFMSPALTLLQPHDRGLSGAFLPGIALAELHVIVHAPRRGGPRGLVHAALPVFDLARADGDEGGGGAGKVGAAA